ncbi:MAG TPA: LuxR C-terminal-related transcriptional regulator [Gaiellaceae bacterium]|nr:LuxR C-terminal-related transcriptional regulator [Gaiellaceae bacterium]
MTTTFGPVGADVERALENISVPSYVIDTAGVIRWVNPAARQVAGDVVGMQFTSVVAPEEVRRSRETFARKIAGTAQATDQEVVIVNGDGERVTVDICSVPLYDGHRVVGVFGQLVGQAPAPAPAHPALTPRQAEILRLLEHGHSTRQIASELHLSLDTVRNHIRFLLRALGAHSRLEAVALARKAHAQATPA